MERKRLVASGAPIVIWMGRKGSGSGRVQGQEGFRVGQSPQNRPNTGILTKKCEGVKKVKNHFSVSFLKGNIFADRKKGVAPGQNPLPKSADRGVLRCF